jgi:uncharacterized membrane protein YfcA
VPFTTTQYILVSLILLASSVLQGSVGFAAGLFGIPLLMLTGIALPQAVAINLVAALVQNSAAVWQLRHEIDYRGAWRPALIRLATLPLGAMTLYYLERSTQSSAAYKDITAQVVGVVVLAIVLTQWLLRVKPRPSLHPAWEWLAFGVGGYVLGLCAMGGPAMVLWVMAHDWPMQRAKAFLYFLFATGVPFQAFFLWLFFGSPILWAMLVGLTTLPAVVAGIYVGLWIGRRIPDRVLRPVAWIVLVLIALCAIASPWLKARPAKDQAAEAAMMTNATLNAAAAPMPSPSTKNKPPMPSSM